MEDKKRTPNFTSSEQSLLLNLVQKHKHVIECKKTDSLSSREKAQVWLQIEKEFNASSMEHHRDAGSLKGKYNNSKKCTQKKIATHKAKVTGTGGGPYTPLQLDELDHKIINIVGTRRVGFQQSLYDDNELEHDDLGQFIIETHVEEKRKSNEGTTICIPDDDDIYEDTVVANDMGKSETSPPLWVGNTTPLLRRAVSSQLRKKQTEPETDFELNPDEPEATDANIPNNSATSSLRNQKTPSRVLLPSGSKRPLSSNLSSLTPSTSTAPTSKDSEQLTKRQKSYTDNVTKWAHGKIMLNKIQETILKEEHDVKVAILKTESKRKMEREDELHQLQMEEMRMRIEVQKLQVLKLKKQIGLEEM